MKYFVNLAISNRREWDSLTDEVEKLKKELERTQKKNADLQAKLKAYETRCLYGGTHCEACKKSRRVSGLISYGMGCYSNTHVCTLNVPCGEFEPKEESAC